jgi:hypothetical protein
MAIADGQVTAEEKKAMNTICRLEGIDESRLLEALNGDYAKTDEEMPNSIRERETYLKDLIRLIGVDGIAAPQFKLDKSTDEALQQIEDKQYAKPFEHDGRTIYKIGINLTGSTGLTLPASIDVYLS